MLGSATPSLEAMTLAASGKLAELDLPERATRAALPEVEIVDLRRMGPGPGGQRLLSLPLYRAIETTLAAGEQCIVFLNRRGFAHARLPGDHRRARARRLAPLSELVAVVTHPGGPG